MRRSTRDEEILRPNPNFNKFIKWCDDNNLKYSYHKCNDSMMIDVYERKYFLWFIPYRSKYFDTCISMDDYRTHLCAFEIRDESTIKLLAKLEQDLNWEVITFDWTGPLE